MRLLHNIEVRLGRKFLCQKSCFWKDCAHFQGDCAINTKADTFVVKVSL